MTKSFIAAVLAASLTITGFSTAPARADAEDIAKVLLGLAIIGGIAHAIDKDNDAPDVSRRDPRPRRHDDRRRIYRDTHTNLPANCLRSFETRRGTRWGYGARCLNRRMHHVNLPNRCERRGEARNGRSRIFYGERCLAQHGFRSVRR